MMMFSEKQRFVFRYEILTDETSPRNNRPLKGTSAVTHILQSVDMETNQYQLGKTKIFIKDPASLFLLEETRERKFDSYARLIQKAFRKHFSQQNLLKQKEEAADIFYQKKERRRHSINRNFFSDYIGMDHKPELRMLVGKREKIEFALTVDEYNKRFKPEKRDLILTQKAVWLIGREKVKSGSEKGKLVPTVIRKLNLDKIAKVSFSPRQDDMTVIHISGDVGEDYASCLDISLKTEFITILVKKIQERCNKNLQLEFTDMIEYTSKKGKIGSDKRKMSFTIGDSDKMILKASGIINKDATVFIGSGLPNTTRPTQNPSKPKRVNNNNNNIKASRPKNNAFSNKSSTRVPPGPPMGPAPSHQPTVRPNVDLNKIKRNSRHKRHTGEIDMSVLNVPEGGVSRTIRESMTVSTGQRPVPGGGRPKPKPRMTKQSLPKVKALYEYQARDVDELSFDVNDILELVKEDDSGWWTGRLNGKEGFFPNNYVQKL